MTIEIPDTILKATGMSEKELIQFLALNLYDKEKLSIGHASKLADLSQAAFIELMTENGIQLKYDVDDLQEDLNNLNDIRDPA